MRRYVPRLGWALLGLGLWACHQKPSIQDFMADHREQPGYSLFTGTTDVIDWKKMGLQPEQIEALHAVHRWQVMVYQNPDSTATKALQQPLNEVNLALRNDAYDNLIKVQGPWGAGSVHALGPDDNIREWVVMGARNRSGMVLLRLEGEQMSPEALATLLRNMPEKALDPQVFQPILQVLAPEAVKK